MAAGDGESEKLITGCEVDSCMAGDELVVPIDGEEGRDADVGTPETYTDGGAEENSLLEIVTGNY